jgi:N6-L-threonylcarbamoyladenine synthase
MLILGIDTSCDDTSCAVVRDGRVLLSNVVSSQVDLHAKYGGVVPEIASRKHLEMMVPVTLEALERANVSLRDLGAVAVTNGPGLLGSLLVGLSFGKSLAFALGIPIAGVHHLDGISWRTSWVTRRHPFPS